MVIVILKDGYAFGFEMASFDKEKALVDRFMSGSLSETTTLDLKSKGSYKVGEIQAMEFTPCKVIKKEEPKKTKKETEQEEKFEAFKDMLRNHKQKNQDDRLKEFEKAMRETKKKP